MNGHPTPEEIELFISKSSLRDDGKDGEIERHLHSCAFCRDLAGEIREFRTAIASLDGEAATDASKPAGRARIYQLHPMVKRSTFKAKRPSIVALAAQDSTTIPHYTPAGTLATIDEGVLLRLTRDNRKQELVVAIVADDPALYDRVLVTFDLIPGEHLTDASGETRISGGMDIDVMRLHAYIHQAVISFDLAEETMDRLSRGEPSTVSEGGIELTMSRAKDTPKEVSVALQPHDGQHTLVLFHDAGSHVIPIHHEVIIPYDVLLKAMLLKLFR